MAKPAEPIARLPRRVMTIAGKIIFEDIPFSEPRGRALTYIKDI